MSTNTDPRDEGAKSPSRSKTKPPGPYQAVMLSYLPEEETGPLGVSIVIH
jgi:hypothetical protein